jgi:hypothetical protein
MLLIFIHKNGLLEFREAAIIAYQPSTDLNSKLVLTGCFPPPLRDVDHAIRGFGIARSDVERLIRPQAGFFKLPVRMIRPLAKSLNRFQTH